MDATCSRPQKGRAVGAEAFASRRSKPSISDDDGGLSDSDSESGSDDDGRSSKEEQGPFEHKQTQPMVRPGRAAYVGIQQRGQVLGVCLWQVPRQDFGCSTHALEHRKGQSQTGFLPQVDRHKLLEIMWQ